MFVRDAGYAEQLARWGLDELAGALAFPAEVGPPESIPKWRRVARGRNDACYRLAAGEGEPAWRFRTLFLKQMRFRPPTLRFLLRPSRLTREAANLNWLARLGVPCPRVVAVGESRQPSGPMTVGFFWLAGAAFVLGALTWVVGFVMSWFAGPRMGRIISHAMEGVIAGIETSGLTIMGVSLGAMAATVAIVAALRWLDRDYFAGGALIVTALEPSEDLWSFAHRHWRKSEPTDAQRAQARRLSELLAAQLAAVHGRRFVHGDLKFRNLLVCWPKDAAPDAGNVRLAWIDCPSGHRRLPGVWLTVGRIKDLANLDRNAARFLSRAERLRFLMQYLTALGGESALAKRESMVRRVLHYNRTHKYRGDDHHV